MTRQVDRYVAENRERIRRVSSRFVEVDSAQDRDLSFGPNLIDVDVTGVAAFARSTGTQALFGHADASKGFGRGTFGDDRREWEELSIDDTDVAFTRQGRRAVAAALDGRDGAVTTSKAGTGTDDPATTDDALTGVYSVARVANSKPDPDSVESSGVHDAASWAGDVIEVGIFDGEDRLLSRVVVDGVGEISPTDDVRLDVTLTFTGSGVGNSVFTDAGDEVVADAMARPLTATGPAEFAFGSGDDEFDRSDTELTDEIFRKGAERDVDRDRIIARTHVFEHEPDTQPVDISEMAVFGTDGRMIWATRLREFTKRDDAGFNAEAEFRVN